MTKTTCKTTRAALALLAALVAAGVRAEAARTHYPGAGVAATVRVGGVWRQPGAVHEDGMRAAFEMALHDSNTADWKHPNLTFVSEVAPSLDSELESPYAVRQLYDAGAVGFSEQDTEDVVRSSGYAAAKLGFPQVETASMTSEMRDQAKFAYTSGLSVSNARSADIIVQLCQHLGWRRLGLVVDTAAETRDLAQLIRAGGAAAGLDVLDPVLVAFDPSVGAGDDLGDLSLYLDQVLHSREARVWVSLVSTPLAARFLAKAEAHGVRTNDFQWIIPPAAFPRPEEMYAMTGSYLGLLKAGDLFPYATFLDTSEAASTAWVTRLVTYILTTGGTGTAPETVDHLLTRELYTATAVLTRAVDALWRLRDYCGGGGAGDNCTALAADAGNDDATLQRLVRTGVAPATPAGGAAVFNPATGERLVALVVVQATLDYTGANVLLSTPGSPVVDLGAWAWPRGAVPADRPSFVRETRSPGTGVYAAVGSLCALGLAVCAACAALTMRYRRRPIMRMSSYRINLLSALGGAALLGVQFTGAMSFTDGVCAARLWTLTLGFTLLFAPMFSKVWRIYRIFGQTTIRAVKITDTQLFRVVGALLLVDAALLGAWQAAAPLRGVETVRDAVPTEDRNTFRVPVDETCEGDLDSVFFPLVLSWKGALLVCGSYLAVKTRGVEIRALNDAKWIGLSIYTTTLIAMLTLPVAFVVGADERDALFVLLAGAAFLIVVSAMALLFLPKFAAIWTGSEAEWTAHGGSVATTGNAAASKLSRPASPARSALSGAAGADSLKGHLSAGPSSSPNSPRLVTPAPAPVMEPVELAKMPV